MNTKNILRIAFVSALSLSALTACDLDVTPDASMDYRESWTGDITVAQAHYRGLASAFRSICGGSYILGQDLQSDLFNASIDFGNSGGPEHGWTFTQDGDYSTTVWEGEYSIIKQCNDVINNIDNITLAADADKAAAQKIIINDIKGEAYLMRAICYHNLAIRFAKDYEASTATAENSGVPLVTTVDINEKPARATLQQTYDFIKKDIAQARLLISDKADASGEETALVNRMNSNAIDLFEARVDLYMDNYKEAAELAEKLIDSGKYPLISSASEFASMWKNDEGSEIIYQPYHSVDERPANMSVYTSKNANYSSQLRADVYVPLFYPTKSLVSLYESSDIRKKAFFTVGYVAYSSAEGLSVGAAYLLNKYPGNPALKKSSGENTYYNSYKLFRIAEAYLIAAEAYYRAGDETNALKVLNQLRTARGASELKSTGTELFNDIKDEWTREFVGEGYRLDGLKRWHDGMKRGTAQYDLGVKNPDPSSIADFIYQRDNFTGLSVDASNKRWLWEIPTNDRIADPAITPNW